MKKKLSLAETRHLLRNSQLPLLLTDNAGSYRGVFEKAGMLAIVKVFPRGGPEDKWSVKFYYPVEALARVMTYWHTCIPMRDPARLSEMQEILNDVVERIYYEETYGPGNRD